MSNCPLTDCPANMFGQTDCKDIDTCDFAQNAIACELDTLAGESQKTDDYNQWFFKHYKNIMGEEFIKND